MARWMMLAALTALSSQFVLASTIPGVQHKVRCDTNEMTVEMMLPDTVTDVYLEGMKEYGKEIGCQPVVDGNTATFRLSVVEFYRCGVTKVVDNTNGRRVYYHRIMVESESQQKESILVKCGWMPHSLQRVSDSTNNGTSSAAVSVRAKRDELSPDFVEETEFDITVVEGRAPEPILGIVVRQNGQLIGSDLNVQPGTLLQMEVFLDPNSTSTYGLRVAHMEVTDRRTKEETIILNGCSVDPYLFENFNTLDGDTLTARFRAFKFPETNYVLFRGTIDVCLDRCTGVECSNDQVAFGRKRRAAKVLDRRDRVFEVSMTTLVKFDTDPALQKDLLDSAQHQAKRVNSVEQPVVARQSQSLLDNESGLQQQLTVSDPHPTTTSSSPDTHASAMFLALPLILTWFWATARK